MCELLSGKIELAVKETDKTELFVGKGDEHTENYEVKDGTVCAYDSCDIHTKACIVLQVSSPIQKPDLILQALKSTHVYEVTHFFSLHDLCVTERQKLHILSLVATTSGEYNNNYPTIYTKYFLWPVGPSL